MRKHTLHLIKMILFLAVLIFVIWAVNPNYENQAYGQIATSSVGAVDSIGVDTTGSGMDLWLYPAYLREGTNVTFSVTGDTLTISGSAGAGTADTTWIHNDANDDSIMASNSAIHLEWGNGIDVTIVGDTATVVVDDAELTLSSIGGAVTDGQVPDSIAITLADGSVTYTKMQNDYRDSLGNLYQSETIAGNWVNTANPWADNEIATSGNWNIAYSWGDWSTTVGKITDDTTNYQTAYGWGDHSAQGYVGTAELHDSCDVLRAEMPDSANPYIADTADVLRGEMGDTADVVRSEVRDTSALVVHDTADVVRGYADNYIMGLEAPDAPPTDNYLLKIDTDPNPDTFYWAVDAGGGGANADSIKSIPIQDTTGNIGDVFGLTFDDSKDTLVWSEFWATPLTAPTDNYVLKVDTDPDPDTLYWAPDIIRKTAEIQTIGAIQTTLASITFLDNNVYEVSATVLGNRSDVTDSWATYRIIASVYRDGGSAVLMGSVSTSHTQEISSDNDNLDATFTVSGNNVRVSVTGLATETWKWRTIVGYINLSN